MSFTPDSPLTAEIPAPPVEQGLNKLHILRLDIQLVPGSATGSVVDVTWAEGFMDGATFKPVRTHNEKFTGAALDAKLAELTTGGSIYGEVKTAVWELLQAGGHIGSGTIG